MAELMTAILRKLGFNEVDTALDGLKAISMMMSKSYSLVISDLIMAPMTGLELLSAVRADDGFGRTPFVLVTASRDFHHAVAAKKAGVNSYLLKPFSPSQLIAAIQTV